jgi:outer membrane protein assembly factor BamB
VLDARTGEVMATFNATAGVRGSMAGTLFVDRDGTLSAISTATGTTKWERPGVSFAAFEPLGDAVYARHGQLPDGMGITALDASTGETRWRKEGTARVAATTAARAYLSGRVAEDPFRGTLRALDARTGDAHWSRRLPLGMQNSFPVDGVASDDVVVVHTVCDTG